MKDLAPLSTLLLPLLVALPRVLALYSRKTEPSLMPTVNVI